MDRLDHGDKMHTSPHGYIGAGWAPNITFASAQLFWFFFKIIAVTFSQCNLSVRNVKWRLPSQSWLCYEAKHP
jgi:hypothetical protein